MPVPMDTRVGPYRILREIKRGGQGSVYLGYDSRLHRRVAIKVYTQPAERAARRAVLREARLVASIQNPRVVQIHDVITSSGYLALVMEYIPGIDLEHFLQVAQPSVSSVLSIGSDLAGALAAARQQRVVHGDLKASNVLIAGNGRAVLTDFGIARAAEDGAAVTAGAGSLSALSPEQYLGEDLDVRSDLFSLGCLMYRMLTGHHPFMRAGRLDTRMLLEEGPPPVEERVPPATELPPGLAELVSRLLRKDPRDRPANTHQVRQILRSVAREVPLSAGNPVLAEAERFFRPQSTEELPPRIPVELGSEGRSRLLPAAQQHPWSWHNPRARPRMAVLGACLLSLVLVAGVLVVRQPWSRPTRVHIEMPVLNVAPDAVLPAGVSVEWLVAEVKAALGEKLGALLVTGPVGATPVTALNARGRSPGDSPPRENYSIGLRCNDSFCLLGLSRRRDELHFSGAVLLFSDNPLVEWRVAVHRAIDELFRQPGFPGES